MSASSAVLSRFLSKTFLSPLPSEKNKLFLSSKRKPLVSVSAFKIGVEEIAELANNKVLVASTLSFAIGQLSKSFASAFNGDGIDLKAAFRSGGMPSVHSASVAAAATSLALDRGLSDAIFGMSVVFAALVMYDAQGVRQEVGYHAKIINESLKDQHLKSKSIASSINSGEVDSSVYDSENANTCIAKAETYSLLKSGVTLANLETLQSLNIGVKEESDKSQRSSRCPLNESVGHTKIQVLAGAFVGFIAYTNELELEVTHRAEENAKLKKQNEELRVAMSAQVPKKDFLQRTSSAPF